MAMKVLMVFSCLVLAVVGRELMAGMNMFSHHTCGRLFSCSLHRSKSIAEAESLALNITII